MQIIRNILRSFGYAIEGIFYMLGTQRNARVECVAGVLVVGVATWLRVTTADWAILLLTIGVVLAAEAINTAIERMVDLLSPERREEAKHAKDAAAAAVLLVSIAAVGVGLVVLGPPLWAKLS